MEHWGLNRARQIIGTNLSQRKSDLDLAKEELRILLWSALTGLKMNFRPRVTCVAPSPSLRMAGVGVGLGEPVQSPRAGKCGRRPGSGLLSRADFSVGASQ